MTSTPQEKQHRLNQLFAAAVQNFNEEEARRCLAMGADVNYRHQGEPLLSFSVSFDTEAMVRLLLDNGADPNACDDKGMTPLDNALDLGELGNAKLLIDRGADVNRQCTPGVTPPAIYSAIYADQLARSTQRTAFLLGYAPDLMATFVLKDGEKITVFDVLRRHVDNSGPSVRPAAEELYHMVDGYHAAKQAAIAEERQRRLRGQSVEQSRKRASGKFKL